MISTLILSFTLLLNPQKDQEPRVAVEVHPGMELLTIILTLSGEYPEGYDSDYRDAVMTHFDEFKTHSVMSAIEDLEDVYPDMSEFGFAISGWPNPKASVPEDLSWYDDYPKEKLATFLKEAVDFAQQSDFWSFYQNHKSDYEKWSAPLQNKIESEKLIERLDAFYQEPNGNAKFQICIDPLNSWGAHAVVEIMDLAPNYSYQNVFTTGYLNRSTNGQPKFIYGDYVYTLIWHEGSHLYIEPYFEKYADMIDQKSQLFNKEASGMKRQGIDTWRECLNENFVRGVVIYLLRTNYPEDPNLWKKQAARDLLNDFIYAERISFLIEEHYNTEEKFESIFTTVLNQI